MEVMPSRILVFLLLLGGITACGEFIPPPSADVEPRTYRVKQGDTLYSIAFQHGHDYREVAAWNHIEQPYTIYPGQELLVMGLRKNTPPRATTDDREYTPSTTPRSTSPGSNGGNPAVVTRPAVLPVQPADSSSGNASTQGNIRTYPSVDSTENSTSPSVETTPPRPHHSGSRWMWPVRGKVIHRYSPANGKKGLDIGGQIGQPVKATAGGTVVYSGSGLIGYGNLVIIKHDDIYLSAYGHNKVLLVKEGDKVQQGQKIAEVGNNKEGPMLHFEIRKNGKPVDPQQFLPR